MPLPPNPRPALKIALVSTPRSGNTWLRMMVASAYELASTAVHDPFALDWHALPDRSIVQVHWAPEPRFVERVQAAGFRVLTIARHPLDVLISILHFCGHEPQTRSWLLGEGGNENDIAFKRPTDAEFLNYATSPRAAALLGVSAAWWIRQPPVARVRYEDLVAAPVATLAGLETAFGPARVAPLVVVDAHRLTALAQTSTNQHFWQGRPGIWRELITPSDAQSIAAAHPAIFEALAYRVDVDMLALDQDRLRANWDRIA